MSIALRLDGVSHRYRRAPRPSLGPLTIELRRGLTALVGVNGAGKSTLLQILGTGLRPTAGSYVASTGAASVPPVELRRRIGYMPQSAQVPGDLRVTGLLDYLGWMRGHGRRVRPGLIEEALAQTDLRAHRDERVGALSGGMFRRLLLAQALLGDPDVLVLDEPTAGLDPEQRVGLRRVLETASHDRIMVVSSHSMEELATITDRIVMLDDGQVVYDGDPADLEQRGRQDLAPDSTISPLEAAVLALRGSGGAP